MKILAAPVRQIPKRAPRKKKPPRAPRKPSPPRIGRWLFLSAGAVFLMALIGAITRLTESGLSIVEWKPIAGALPPLNAADWAHEFDLYRHTPQYLKVNRGMTLEEFQQIYFWEWLHRLWGRTIALIYFIPLCWYWLKGKLPAEAKPAFIGVLILGGAQGALGWFMVKSGLVDNPAVSPYRLAAHLMLAFFLYACLFRLGLSFTFEPEKEAGRVSVLRGPVKSVIALAAVTMTWGAFVAGFRAGWLYNHFPMMDETHWLPPELFQFQPMILAFIAEPACVQFTHRCLAILTFCSVVLLVRKSYAFHCPPRVRRLFTALLCIAVLQVALGISTLLTHVNIILATLHQAGALTLLTLLVWLLHEIPFIPREK